MNKEVTKQLVKTFSNDGKLNVQAMMEHLYHIAPILRNYDSIIIDSCAKKRRMSLLTQIYETEKLVISKHQKTIS